MPVAPRPMKGLDLAPTTPAAGAAMSAETFASFLTADAVATSPDADGAVLAGAKAAVEEDRSDASTMLLPLIEQQRAALVSAGLLDSAKTGPTMTIQAQAKEQSPALESMPSATAPAAAPAAATASPLPVSAGSAPFPHQPRADSVPSSASAPAGDVATPAAGAGGKGTSGSPSLPTNAAAATVGVAPPSAQAEQAGAPHAPTPSVDAASKRVPAAVSAAPREAAAAAAPQANELAPRPATPALAPVEGMPANDAEEAEGSTPPPAAAVAQFRRIDGKITSARHLSSSIPITPKIQPLPSDGAPAAPGGQVHDATRTEALQGIKKTPAASLASSVGTAPPMASVDPGLATGSAGETLSGAAAVSMLAPPSAAISQQPALANLSQALAAQVLNITADGAWIDDLARDISRMASGSGDLRFRLTPETLGEMKVEISQSDRGAVIRMTVGSEAAQAALAEAQPKLVAEARAHGVRIADAQVDLASSHQQRGDAQRQQPAPDQPLRALRHPNTEIRPTAARAAAGRADRYA